MNSHRSIGSGSLPAGQQEKPQREVMFKLVIREDQQFSGGGQGHSSSGDCAEAQSFKVFERE